MDNASSIINLVLKAVALGMAVVSIVLGFLPEVLEEVELEELRAELEGAVERKLG